MAHYRQSLVLVLRVIAALVCFGITLPGVAQASFVFSHNEDASYVSLLPADHELVETDSLGAYVLYGVALTSLLLPEVNIDAVDLLSSDRMVFSLSEDTKIGGTVYADEDLLLWDGTSISLLWDGSNNGLPLEVNLDAVDIISESPLEFSFSLEEDTRLPGVGMVADEDMARFVTGSGFLPSLDFDGSLEGVPSEVDLNAFSRDTDTVWILSFDAATRINAILYDDSDLIAFNSAGGTFSLYFDSSAQSIPEQVDLDAMALPTPTPTPTPTITPTPTPTAIPTGCVTIPVDTWAFEPPPEGWNYQTAVPPSDIPAWSHASSVQVSGPGAIGLTAPVDETTDHYGSWDNYSGNPDIAAISWVDNSVWRAVFTMSTDKSDPNTVPSIRLRFVENHMKATSYIQVLPGGWLPIDERGVSTTDYKLYLRPPIVDNGFFLAFDMIDFGQPFGLPCDGTVYLEEVAVERFDLTDPCFDSYWTDVITYSGTGLHGWTHSSAGVHYLTDVNGYSQPADGLEQNTTMAQTRTFGAWTSPSEVDLITDQFYRAIWTLACEDSSLGGAERVRMHTVDFRYSSYMVVDRDINPANSALPPAGGKDYYIYAEFPGSPTVDKLLLAWDLFEFDPSAGGWAKLTDVTVSRRDLP